MHIGIKICWLFVRHTTLLHASFPAHSIPTNEPRKTFFCCTLTTLAYFRLDPWIVAVFWGGHPRVPRSATVNLRQLMLLWLACLMRRDIYCNKMLHTTGEPFIYSALLRTGGCISVEADVSSHLFLSVSAQSPIIITRYSITHDGLYSMEYNGTTPNVATVDQITYGKALFVYRVLQPSVISVGYGGFNMLPSNCSQLVFDSSQEVASTFLTLPITETTCFLYTAPGTHVLSLTMGKCYSCPTFRAFTGIDHVLASVTSGVSVSVSQPAENSVSYIVVEPPTSGESDLESILFTATTDRSVPETTRQLRARALPPLIPDQNVHTRYVVDILAYSFVSLLALGTFVLVIFVFCKERNWGKRENTSIGHSSLVSTPTRRTSSDFIRYHGSSV